MSGNRRKLLATVAALVILPLIGWLFLLALGLVAPPGEPVKPPFNMSDRIATIRVEEQEPGEFRARFSGWDEERVPLSGEEFLAEVHRRQVDLPWVFRVLDVTSVISLAWVVFGFAGQAVFAGRMIVQWYVSEKMKASVVPTIFWWMSLLGSSMLIIYFIWRKEIVGVCGQATGWIVYVRNLWMIYGEPAPPAATEKTIETP